MDYKIAITRTPGATFDHGITTFTGDDPVYQEILSQHAAYINTMQSLGLKVINLEPLEAYPDAYFVEDVAVITPNRAVITRPGAQKRRGEPEFITSTLEKFKELVWIKEPGTCDGGDVLMADNHCYIGLSQRTNKAGAVQLGNYLQEEGINWTPIKVNTGLHLKSDVNYIGHSTLLMTSKMADLEEFKSFRKIILENDQAYAANSLLINGHLLTPQGFPEVHNLLEKKGYDLIKMDTSEIQKMDGGLTCMSLRLS